MSGRIPLRERRRCDDGFVAAEWAVGMALLVLPLVVVVAVLPTWSGRHAAAAAAAREGARVAALADTGAAADQAARAAVAQVLADRGVDGPVEVEVTVPGPGLLPREGVVEVHVALPTQPVPLPLVGDIPGPTVSAGHHRALDPLRSR